ncbi:hypothetical protein RMSM_02446 [Rhodopirellula maiorica SM1]|uniref:Uncharacterized protein n=1 Tax=Rhodopirellula maiorica SM1 TaxID=1265738 RepID=M5RN59_9BACT|nr:hypothetical protein RMSM_02446 [Rhodopirellula maiorica SM1]
MIAKQTSWLQKRQSEPKPALKIRIPEKFPQPEHPHHQPGAAT